MLDRGVIHPSQSPWCNAVVLVHKKNGGLRFCIDFHKLNNWTKKDAFPLPWMQETMESMVGAQFFSTMDLKLGFWQVKIAKESQQYTAFMVGSMGVNIIIPGIAWCNPLCLHRFQSNTYVVLHFPVPYLLRDGLREDGLNTPLEVPLV